MTEVEPPSVKDDQPKTSPPDAQEEAPAGAPSLPSVVDPPATTDATGEATAEDGQPIGEPAPHETSNAGSETPPAEQAPEEITPVVVEPIPEPQVIEVVSSPSVARDITLIWSNTADLLKFVRFTDFVLCDFNQDGIADILALSSRMSTGYGFRGIGNGLFAEGPSFDLPFRPTAAVSLGGSDETVNGLFLISASGIVSMFYPLTGEDPSAGITPDSFSVYRLDSETGPVFAVHGEGETVIRVFLASDKVLQDLGEHPATLSVDITGWYGDIVVWSYLDQAIPFPLPPSGVEKTARIADLNGDGILDLVYYDSGRIVCQLSRDGEPLMEEQAVPCSAKPVAIRIADVDGNGFPDVLALIGSSGTLEVYLVEPK